MLIPIDQHIKLHLELIEMYSKNQAQKYQQKRNLKVLIHNSELSNREKNILIAEIDTGSKVKVN